MDREANPILAYTYAVSNVQRQATDGPVDESE